jgi:hypothetical protein
MAQNQVGMRLVFENARKFVASQGYDVSQAVLTQSYVRSEVAASTSLANYRLPIVVNDTTNSISAFNTEKRVQLQDIHVVYEMGLFIAKPSSSTDTTFKLYTNPNATAFPTGASSLQTLYNGFLNMQVNNQNILPAIDTFRFYNVPQTQNGVGVTAQTVFPADQENGSTDGFYAVEPNLLLNGAANIVFNLTLPAAFATLDANTRIVAIFRTILAQNVTSVK